MQITPSAPSAPRRHHPLLPELVGGIDLKPSVLSAGPDADEIGEFIKMLVNAEYWIGFDLASFEPMLTQCPSPLRELGVGILLKYCEHVDGALGSEDLQRAHDHLKDYLPQRLWVAVSAGIASLSRAVLARDNREAWLQDGFQPSQQEAGFGAHALRAMGSAHITIEGVEDEARRPQLQVGTPIVLSATDERGRELAPPETASKLAAEVLTKDERHTRTVVFVIPGEYQVSVPTKATGSRKLLLT